MLEAKWSFQNYSNNPERHLRNITHLIIIFQMCSFDDNCFVKSLWLLLFSWMLYSLEIFRQFALMSDISFTSSEKIALFPNTSFLSLICLKWSLEDLRDVINKPFWELLRTPFYFINTTFKIRNPGIALSNCVTEGQKYVGAFFCLFLSPTKS